MRISLLFALTLFLFTGCGGEEADIAEEQSAAEEQVPQVDAAGCDDNNELIIVEERLGEGQEATINDAVIVDYIGKLDDGTVFNDFDGVLFRLDEVVDGFRDGIAGMKVGGQRTLTIPPNLAYGPNPPSPMIPSCATLTFEIELLEIQR